MTVRVLPASEAQSVIDRFPATQTRASTAARALKQTTNVHTCAAVRKSTSAQGVKTTSMSALRRTSPTTVLRLAPRIVATSLEVTCASAETVSLDADAIGVKAWAKT